MLGGSLSSGGMGKAQGRAAPIPSPTSHVLTRLGIGSSPSWDENSTPCWNSRDGLDALSSLGVEAQHMDHLMEVMERLNPLSGELWKSPSLVSSVLWVTKTLTMPLSLPEHRHCPSLEHESSLVQAEGASVSKVPTGLG